MIITTSTLRSIVQLPSHQKPKIPVPMHGSLPSLSYAILSPCFESNVYVSMPKSVISLDLDLPRLRRRRFRDHDAQDAILQARLDRVLVHASGERERAVEFADHALADPVLVLRRLLGFGFGSPLRHFGGCRLGGGRSVGALFVFNRGFVVGWRWRRSASVGDAAGRRGVFDRARRGRAGRRVLALRVALDDEGVRVGELDADVFLVDARQFAVQLVRVFYFFDVEAGLEGADAGGAASGAGAGAGGLGAVDVVVVEEAEEGTEVRGGGEGGEE